MDFLSARYLTGCKNHNYSYLTHVIVLSLLPILLALVNWAIYLGRIHQARSAYSRQVHAR
jgi:hypothetical protein